MQKSKIEKKTLRSANHGYWYTTALPTYSSEVAAMVLLVIMSIRPDHPLLQNLVLILSLHFSRF